MIGLARAATFAVAGLLSVILAANTAQADFITDGSTFDAANSGLDVLDFEGIASPGNFAFVGSFAAPNVTITGDRNAISIVDSAAFFDTPTDVLFEDVFGGLMTLSFGPGVNAVGFNVGIGFAGGTGTFNVFNGADLLDTRTLPIVDQTLMSGFVGWSGLGNITHITFAVASADEFALIDNLRYAQGLVEVPEPATMALFCAGLICLVMLARRRKAT